MALTLTLTLTFRTSDNLAAAFGIAVALTMLLTSVLVFHVMREIWHWSLPLAGAVAGLFILVDLSFVSANMMKVFEGGWVPLVVAAIIFALMSVWRDGRQLLVKKLERDTLPLSTFIQQMHNKPRVHGSAVYLTNRLDVVPVPLLHNLKHNKILHERIVLMQIKTKNIPHVDSSDRIEVHHLADNYHTITVNYGFMDSPNIPRALDECAMKQLRFNMMDTSFFVGRFTIVPKKRAKWRKFETKIFEAMHRNALPATEFFRIPPNRVVELGTQIEV
jgi:KUP system potassium uptake protein